VPHGPISPCPTRSFEKINSGTRFAIAAPCAASNSISASNCLVGSSFLEGAGSAEVLTIGRFRGQSAILKRNLHSAQ